MSFVQFLHELVLIAISHRILMEDSNLQTDRYERVSLSENTRKSG
jgi:hypothetical protein